MVKKKKKNTRYSHLRLLEIVWYFFKRFFKIRRKPIADNVTATAMVPRIMPTSAPVLIPDDEELPITVTQKRN